MPETNNEHSENGAADMETGTLMNPDPSAAPSEEPKEQESPQESPMEAESPAEVETTPPAPPETGAAPEEEPVVVEEEEAEPADAGEDMATLYEESLSHIEEGQIIPGTVLQVKSQEVIVDVGFKSEGAIPLEEFKDERGSLSVKAGDKVEVFLEATEDKDGHVVLSKEKADKAKIWDELSKIYKEEAEVEGRVIERVKGGLAVDIGVRAFLPGSQIDLRPVRNLESMAGEKIKVKILKLNRMRNNVVVSRRVILEKEMEGKREETLDNIKIGELMKGIVKNITEYGAFIDLGGVDGLLHVTDMSWGRISHPSELLMVGDEVDVVILKFDLETNKVSLGLKQKTADPWQGIDEKYPVTEKIKGKIVSLTDYGAFVELEEGVEGLIHVSEMSWTRRVKHPSKVVAVGDIVEAVVLDVNAEKKRISLGLKQTEPNPWDLIVDRYPIGALVSGKIRNMTDFGAFIGLEEGIDGLVHISDISWTKKLKHPSEVLKKSEVVQAIVLNIDRERERLSLGIKQLHPDPWETIPQKYSVGRDVRGRVVTTTDFGAFVELEDGVEALIHISELSKGKVDQTEDVVREGEEITARIIKIDPTERKLALSIKAMEEGVDRSEIDEYLDRQDSGEVTLGMIVQEQGRAAEDKEEIPEEAAPEEAPPEEATAEEASTEEASPEEATAEEAAAEEAPAKEAPAEEATAEEAPAEEAPAEEAPAEEATAEEVSPESEEEPGLSEESSPPGDEDEVETDPRA